LAGTVLDTITLVRAGKVHAPIKIDDRKFGSHVAALADALEARQQAAA
jgi:hypothetical protein